MRPTARRGRGGGTLLCIFALAVAAYACAGHDEAPLAGLAKGCILNTDCNAPLVCAFRKCHEACTDSRDCKEDGQRCVAGDRPFHVCQLVDERDCTYNSDCAGGQTCGIDFQCRDQCVADRDCLNEQVCFAGACADVAELDASLLTSGAAGDAAAGQRCLYTSECAAPLVCRNHFCALECRAASDCAAGADCANNRCVSSGGMTIGVAGGFLTSATGKIEIDVPANALAAPVPIAIFSLEAWPRGALGPVFEIVPTGTVFRAPSRLTYHYDDADIGGTSPAQLRIAVATGAAWTPLPSMVDAGAKTVTTMLEHLSVYGLVGPDGTFATIDGGSSADATTDTIAQTDVARSDALTTGSGGTSGTGGSPGTGGASGASGLTDAESDASSFDTGPGGSGGVADVDAGPPGSGGTSIVDAAVDVGSSGSGGGTGGSGGAIPDGNTDIEPADAVFESIDDADSASPDASATDADASSEPQCFVICDGPTAPCRCSTTCVESTYTLDCGFDVNGALVCTCDQNGNPGATFSSDTCDPNFLSGRDPGCGYPILIVVGAQ